MNNKRRRRDVNSELRGREVQIMIKLRKEKLRTCNLVDLVGISSPNTSKALGFLRLKKYVDSVRSLTNGIVIYHSLTRTGHAYLDSLI